MNTEQILQVIDAISQSSLSEFKYEGDGVKFSMKKPEKHWKQEGKGKSENPVVSFSEPECGSSPEKAEPVPPVISSSQNVIKSPLVGTFYAAPSEDAESFVRIGDHVEKGQVLAIIEAMKLMNEIESDFTGTVAEILVQNGEAVEYGQPLFVIQ